MRPSTAQWRNEEKTYTEKLGLGGLCPFCWSGTNNSQYNNSNNNNSHSPEPHPVHYVQHRKKSQLDLAGSACRQQSPAVNIQENTYSC